MLGNELNVSVDLFNAVLVTAMQTRKELGLEAVPSGEDVFVSSDSRTPPPSPSEIADVPLTARKVHTRKYPVVVVFAFACGPIVIIKPFIIQMKA